jgi:alpha-tubulin suppressor-like RCC1 family protein
VTAGTGFTCIADSTGDVQCWGNNVHEQLGHDTPGASAVPLAALQLGATALSDGSEHLCAVNGSGALECWGRGDRGQLGDGSVVDSSVPRQAFAGSVVEAATYGENTCARMQGGAVQCWGSNGSGQVGDVSLGDPVTTPSLVPNVSNATSITVGWGFACAVTGGEVVCWGDGGNGRLGNGSTSNVDAAAGPLTPVVGVSGAVAVGAGSEFACALLDSGAVSCWGRNQYGTLGVAPASMSSSATSVEVIDSGIVALAVGPTYACAIDTNEAIRCWGNNRDGQLGMAPGGIQSTPVTVQPPPDVGFRRVSAGTSHVCTRVTTGEVFCWGDNINGQLGNGEHVARMTPTEPIFAGAAVGTVCSGNQDCASGICPSVPSWPNRICLYDGAWCSASRADTSTFQEGTLTYGAGSFTVTGFDDTEGTVTDCPAGTTSTPATSTTISGGGCTVSVSALDDGCDFTVSGSGWTYVRGAWR